jgi:hypothetical protein
MANIIPFDHACSLGLLKPLSLTVFKPEEDQHPWRTQRCHTFNKPFLRIWDHYSGSQPSGDCLRSRAPYQRLDTYDLRKASLSIHVDYRDWRPTPYISFTSSPSTAQKIADMRVQPRGPHTLTVVDPDARVKKGLPILDIATEMKSYEIPDPYQKGGQYYNDHYLCLWQVSGNELVGEWQWDELIRHRNWYEDIVMPAFRQHREEAVRDFLQNENLNLSALASALPSKCLQAVPWPLLGRESADVFLSGTSCLPYPAHFSHGFPNTSSEGLHCYAEDDDSDDKSLSTVKIQQDLGNFVGKPAVAAPLQLLFLMTL